MTESSKVLVSGGCGFIGTTLVRALGRSGSEIRVLDNMAHPASQGVLPESVEVMQGDIRHESDVAAAMDGASIVVHLAASGSVIQSVEDPATNFEVNARGTLNVLQAARDARVERFIFASTGGALIGNAVPPVNEDSVPQPISPYGAGKLCGEAYCHAFAKSYGLPTVALRFANVYGPHSAHKRGAITAFIKAIRANEPMVIYGDGTASRDFLYVDDLCDGIVRGAFDASLAPGTVLHLASGAETRVSELAQEIADVAGQPDYPVRFEARRPGEVGRNFANYERAQDLLGFRPQWSLREGLRRTWDWFAHQDHSTLQQATTDA